MTDDRRIPVTVVTGFLGAGKTTLVNGWLDACERGEIAVIVNEHGAVGIDAELLAARARTIVEITGGCICCRTQEELVRALDDLASSSHPKRVARVLIETSGAASPAGVLAAIARGGVNRAFALDGVVTVVDSTRVDALGEHDLAFEQIGYADIVVLSRADACERSVLEIAGNFVSSINGAAFQVRAARGHVIAPPITSLEELLDRRRADFVSPPQAPAGTAHQVYESVALTVDGEIDGERFADFVESELERVAGRLFRIKGILALAGAEERMIVQGVADSIEVTFGDAWAGAERKSRLVIVGFGLDRAALERGFAGTASRTYG